MLTSLFFIFVKKLKMKKLLIISLFSIFLFGCPPEKIDPPLYDSNYGKGLYILSENSISYYDYSNNAMSTESSSIKYNIYFLLAYCQRQNHENC